MKISVEFEELQRDISEEKRWSRIYYVAALETLTPAFVAAVVRQLRRISGVQIVNHTLARQVNELGLHISINNTTHSLADVHPRVIDVIRKNIAEAYGLTEIEVEVSEEAPEGQTVVLKTREPTAAERQAE